MRCSVVDQSVLWSHQQSPPLPPMWVSCCTWGTVYFVPVRLSSRWWGSSADQKRWVKHHAYVDPDGGGPQSPCVQPLSTPSHLQEPTEKAKTINYTFVSNNFFIILYLYVLVVHNKNEKHIINNIINHSRASPVSYHQNKGCPQWTPCPVKHSGWLLHCHSGSSSPDLHSCHIWPQIPCDYPDSTPHSLDKAGRWVAASTVHGEVWWSARQSPAH